MRVSCYQIGSGRYQGMFHVRTYEGGTRKHVGRYHSREEALKAVARTITPQDYQRRSRQQIKDFASMYPAGSR